MMQNFVRIRNDNFMADFFYYNEIFNFGDAINPYLMARVFGLETRWRSALRADLYGVGSLLQFLLCRKHRVRGYFIPFLTSRVHVWTSGFVAEPQPNRRLCRRIVVHALRGKLSQALVERLTGKKIEVPLGDGGLLFSRLLEKAPTKNYRLGIIPHVADIQLPVFAKLHAQIPHSAIIDLRAPPLSVLERIAACDCIVSSAMHGLIAADALGIPNRWIEVSNQVVGNGFKFRDYYSVFDSPPTAPMPMLLTTPIPPNFPDQIERGYAIRRDEVARIQARLYAAFPKF